MKITSAVSGLAIALLIHGANGSAFSPVIANPGSPKFYCGKSKNVPTTIGRTSRGPAPIIRWSYPGFGEQYSPEERCKIVSARFQTAYENGTLNFLRAAYLNKNPVICAVANRESPCSVLFTLKPGSDPNQTLRQLLNLRIRATSEVLNESVPPTEINMNDFLANAPVDGSIAEQQPSSTVVPSSQPTSKLVPKVVPSSQPVPKVVPSSQPIW